MKKIILFIACMSLIPVCFAQKNFNKQGAGSSGAANSNYDIYLRTIDVNQKALAFGISEAEFNAIKDDAYANSNFLVGNIYQDDQLLKSIVPMRYNAYADEIEIKSHAMDENYGALMKDPSIYVKINTDIYVFFPYEGSNEKGGYFNLLTEGKTYSLYKKTKAVFKEAKKAKSSYQNNTPASFDKAITYYLMYKGTLLELPTNKPQLLKVMDLKKEEIKKYLKDNNLDVDKEKDLIKVVAYFDSLL